MCEYCEGDREIVFNKFMRIKVEKFIDNLTLRVDTRESTHTRVDINYCPMCGRKLGEEK